MVRFRAAIPTVFLKNWYRFRDINKKILGTFRILEMKHLAFKLCISFHDESGFYRISVCTHKRIKNTLLRIKFLLLLACLILFFTEHSYFSMRISPRIFFTLGKE